MSIRPPKHLPDSALTQALDQLASEDRVSDARVVAHVAEFDARKLFLPAGYQSMFRYCVERLRMSEDIAYKRVRVARVARRVPSVFDALEDGRLNLSAITLLARHLTRTNAAEVLREAERLTRSELQMLVARRFGSRPPGPPAALVASASDGRALADMSLESVTAPAAVTELSREQAPGPVELTSHHEEWIAPAPPPRRARVQPFGPGTFELVAILGQEAYDQLVASRELLGHAVPSGDLAEVLERAIALQHEHLRKRRCAETEHPRAPKAEPSANPRQVPAAVQRAIWERDGGSCAFVSADGHRCGSRENIEIDHIVPVAHGGRPTADNLRLVCRAHNRHLAEQAFGRHKIQSSVDAARQRRATERWHREAERARAEKRRVALARQDEEAGGALRTLGYRGLELRRALAYCVDRADSPLEERLKYALGRMAPTPMHADRQSCSSGPAPLAPDSAHPTADREPPPRSAPPDRTPHRPA